MNYFSFLLLIGIILTTMELLLPTNFFIASLGISFIFGAFFSFFTSSFALILFFISSFAIGLFFLMRKFKFFHLVAKYDTSRDAYIGKQVTIEKIIDKNKGIVKIYSEFWVCKSNKDIKEKDVCIIKDIKGNTFIIEKEGEKNEY